MPQVKKTWKTQCRPKKICTLVQVCRENRKGSKVCRGRKKFENHWFIYTKAWMTAIIFEKWVKKLDLQMRKRQRKISLVLDNSQSVTDFVQES